MARTSAFLSTTCIARPATQVFTRGGKPTRTNFSSPLRSRARSAGTGQAHVLSGGPDRLLTREVPGAAAMCLSVNPQVPSDESVAVYAAALRFVRARRPLAGQCEPYPRRIQSAPHDLRSRGTRADAPQAGPVQSHLSPCRGSSTPGHDPKCDPRWVVRERTASSHVFWISPHTSTNGGRPDDQWTVRRIDGAVWYQGPVRSFHNRIQVIRVVFRCG